MLRSLAAWTTGNPGPSTLQFRRRAAQLAASARQHARDQSTTQAERAELDREVRRARQRAARGHTPWRGGQGSSRKPSTPVRSALREGMPSERLSPGRNPPEDVAILLAPPRDQSAIDRHVDAMADFLEDGRLRGALRRWSRLMELNATTCVSDDEYAWMTGKLVLGLQGNMAGEAAALFYHEPVLFDALRHFVIEAATLNHWRGLHAFMLVLLRYALPQAAADAYEAYTRRARVVASIDVADLFSPERARRVAARLTGPGQLPLVVAQVAAFTMLEQFDQKHIMSLFNTTANLFSKSDLENAAWETQTKAFWGARNGRDLIERFRRNCDKLVVALYCYHPPAFTMHITSISQNGPSNQAAVNRIYELIMESSLGPDRFIIPTEGSQDLEIVSLTYPVWVSFMNAFARVQRPEKIMRIIETDIPARHGKTPTAALAHAMQALAMAAKKEPDLHPWISGNVEKIWKRLQAMGADNDPYAVRCRLLVLRLMGQVERYEETAGELHTNLRLALHPEASLAIFPQLFAHLCIRARFDDALAVVRSLDPIMDVTLLGEFGSKDLVTNACFSQRFSYAQRRRLLTEVLRRIPPRLQQLGPNAGSVLSFLLEGGKPVPAACASVCTTDAGAQYYFGFIRRLLVVHWTDVPLANLEAAVHVLEHYVPTDTMIAGARYVAIWTAVVTAVAKSPVATARQRHQLLERVVAAFPSTTECNNGHLIMVLRLAVLASLQRPDAQGAPEAAHWWAVHRAATRTGAGSVGDQHQLETMVHGFVTHDLPHLALDVLWAAVRRNTLLGAVRELLSEREAWTSGPFEDLLQANGFIDEKGIVDDLPRTRIAYEDEPDVQEDVEGMEEMVDAEELDAAEDADEADETYEEELEES